MIRLILRRRCDHCHQRVDSRVLYDGEQWCAPCAISDARQMGITEGLVFAFARDAHGEGADRG